MAIKINQYPIERTTFGDDDYYDIDYWNGTIYETAKIKGSTIKTAIRAGMLNFYENNSAITTNREVSGGGTNELSFGINTLTNNLAKFNINAIQSSEKYSGIVPFNIAGLEITKSPSINKSVLLLNATNGTSFAQEVDNHYFTAQVGNNITNFRINDNQILTNITDGINPLSHKITHDWVEIIQNTAKPVLKLEHEGGLLEFGGLQGLGNGGSNLVQKIKFNVPSSTVYDMLDFAGTVGLRLVNYTTTGGLNNYSTINGAKSLYLSSGGGSNLHLQTSSGAISVNDISSGSAVSMGSWTNTRLNVIGNIEVSGVVDGRDVATDGIKLDTIETGAQVNDIVTKTITIQEPEVGDNITVFRTDKDITVQEVITVSTGTGTISTSYQISFSSQRNGTGSNLVGNQATTSITNGDVATLATTQIPADSWVFIKINTVSGNDVYLSADIRFTED
tara:strand:- start:16918 stop:18264 length:1347 start_codon:yes stop_codon:yes gene_type:complete